MTDNEHQKHADVRRDETMTLISHGQGATVDRIIERNTPTDDERARALHDAFWAVHVGRFYGRTAEHGIDTFYAGTNAAKRAIENLHGSPIIRPWSDQESQPQGEPSDAQVLAAMNAANPRHTTTSLDDYADYRVEEMRAALRAAGGVLGD